MRDTPRKPPPWRSIAASLRDYFKPKAKQLTEADEQRIVDDFRERVPRAVEIYKSTATARNAPASLERLLVVLDDTIDELVQVKAPGKALARQQLADRLRRELPGLVTASWRRNSAKKPPLVPTPPALEPIRPSAKAMAMRIERSPDEQRRIDEFHAGIGAALAANLNRNVLAQDEQVRPPGERAMIDRWHRELGGEAADMLNAAVAAHDRAEARPKPYLVESYDPYPAPSEWRPMVRGRYETAGAALVAAQGFIDEELLRTMGYGKTAAAALELWMHFGERPMIRGPTRVEFDPIGYARRRAAELAAIEADPDGSRFKRFLARTNPPADENGQLLLPFV